MCCGWRRACPRPGCKRRERTFARALSGPLRVLHVHSGNLYGGVETLLLSLWRGRALRPTLEHAFALCFEGRLAEELRAAGADVHLLSPVRASRPWTVLRAQAALFRLLGRHRPDVALSHSSWSQGVLGPAVRARGVPSAFFLHDVATGRHWVERGARLVRPGLVLCNSHFTKESAPRLYPRVPAEVLYLPVSPPPPPAADARIRVREELGVPQDATVLVQVSRMEAWKGHSLHLEALGRLRGVPGWRCWMVGGAQRPHERVYLARLQRQAEALGLLGRVQFLGHCADLPRLLAAADVHCQPNLGPEPFGLTFVEALAAGLPVVTTALGGAREIVDESCGVLVSPTSEALAAALHQLIEDGALRQRLGQAGPSRARALCDPSVRLAELEALLRRAAASA